MSCKCFYRDRDRGNVLCYVVFEDGTVWGLHAKCPVHGIEPIEVVWAPVFQSQTATVEAAAV